MKRNNRYKWYELPSPFLKLPQEYCPIVNPCLPLLPSQMLAQTPSDQLKQQWLESCAYRFYLAYSMAIHRRFPTKAMKAELAQIPRRFTEETRPLSEYLGSILELCIECQAIPTPFNHHYRFPSERFREVFAEMLQHELADPDTPGGMTEEIRKMRHEISCLKNLDDWSNPYNQRERPHLWRLMEDARRRAEEDDGFRSHVFLGRQRSKKAAKFKPFLETFRDWLTDLEQNWATAWIEDGRIVQQVGRGKTTEYLPPPPSLKVLMQKVELETPM